MEGQECKPNGLFYCNVAGNRWKVEYGRDGSDDFGGSNKLGSSSDSQHLLHTWTPELLKAHNLGFCLNPFLAIPRGLCDLSFPTRA